MQIKVLIPSAFRRFCGGEAVIDLDADTAAAALLQLGKLYPELGSTILNQDGRPKSFSRVFVNAVDMSRPGRANAPLNLGDTIAIITAFSGG